jgi:hypothetical protein
VEEAVAVEEALELLLVLVLAAHVTWALARAP